MKKAILTMMLTFAAVVFVSGQCAIYVCTSTGAWGGVYNDGSYPIFSMEKIKAEAYRICTENGGTDCEFYFSHDCSDCYWAFIIGEDEDSFDYMAAISYTSEEDAANLVRRKYREGGGTNPSTARVTTWYVPKY